jgi:hypothetical protein
MSSTGQKVLVDKEFILDAYDAACDKWKRKLREELPDIFECTFNDKKVYILNGVTDYKLTRIETTPPLWAFVSLRDSICWANGKHRDVQQTINNAVATSRVFIADSVEDYYKGNGTLLKFK